MAPAARRLEDVLRQARWRSAVSEILGGGCDDESAHQPLQRSLLFAVLTSGAIVRPPASFAKRSWRRRMILSASVARCFSFSLSVSFCCCWSFSHNVCALRRASASRSELLIRLPLSCAGTNQI